MKNIERKKEAIGYIIDYEIELAESELMISLHDMSYLLTGVCKGKLELVALLQ